MNEQQIERTQCMGVIGSLLIAALVTAVAVLGLPGAGEAGTSAAPVLVAR
jgi:hypothetical protein